MIVDGSTLLADQQLTCDVVIIGSGPGGALAAAKIAASGARVIVIEEGPWLEPKEFVGEEESAYPRLYQDAGGRATDDLAITILQGRAAGGGSTINWMTSLRTPESTLDIWRDRFELPLDRAALRRSWQEVEARLNIHPASPDDINTNNRVLLDGAAILGIPTDLLPRNTRDCTNLGVCSFGCPTGAKQSAQETYLRDAIAAGALLYTMTRAERLVVTAGRVSQVVCSSGPARARTVTIRCSDVFVAGGAINSPALLLRSRLESPAVGRRTWLHPVVAMVAEFEQRIDAWYGSPQSVASQHFAQRGEQMGYFLETPPLHPMLAALAAPWLGAQHAALMQQLPHVNALIALNIDGFDASEEGGRVTLRRDGRISFRYPFSERLAESARDAMQVMARIQLAAGARRIVSLHTSPVVIESERDVKQLETAAFGPGRLSVFTAHQMGGCAMGSDRRRSVVDVQGVHHDVRNLRVCDGSLFPTSLGVNPMLSIYGVAAQVIEAFLKKSGADRVGGGIR